MVTIRKIKKVWKGRRLMDKIVLADSKKQLTDWRIRNKYKYATVFYGSPRKDAKGYYALIESKRRWRK